MKLIWNFMIPQGASISKQSAKETPDPKDSWDRFGVHDYPFTGFPAGARVVDVGCGPGNQLQALVERGCDAIGVEPSHQYVEICRSRGLKVEIGTAEAMPLANETADGIVCKVVIPLTDERRAVANCARVLKHGGRMEVCYQGAGYYVRYLLHGTSLARRFYGFRTLINTWFYSLAGRRLPGWIGDTTYQSRRRLEQYYSEFGLMIDRDTPSPRFLGLPVFIYHSLVKR